MSLSRFLSEEGWCYVNCAEALWTSFCEVSLPSFSLLQLFQVGNAFSFCDISIA